MKELVGKWKLQHDKNDNFEEYLKAVGEWVIVSLNIQTVTVPHRVGE